MARTGGSIRDGIEERSRRRTAAAKRASLRQQAGYGAGALKTAQLLVVAGGEEHRAPGPEVCFEEMLGRFEEADQVSLVVERTPSPDVAAGSCARKRRLLPDILGLGVDGNDILVRQ
jgi:hypothetical protein